MLATAGITSSTLSRQGQGSAAPYEERSASDWELIKVIARGNRAAMAALYRRHHVRVYRFALRITDNATLAEDIVSDVFLDVWRLAGTFKGDAQVSTWLLSIARNKCLSTFRRRIDEPLDDAKVGRIADGTEQPEALVQRKDRNAALQRCISKLSHSHREVIDLCYYHEKSVGEVAQILGVPPNTVKTRMFYARCRLESLLRAAGIDSI